MQAKEILNLKKQIIQKFKNNGYTLRPQALEIIIGA